MKAQVYISRQDKGWSKFEIPAEFQKLSYEKLVNRIHTLIERGHYKGLLITQNPAPFG